MSYLNVKDLMSSLRGKASAFVSAAKYFFGGLDLAHGPIFARHCYIIIGILFFEFWFRSYLGCDVYMEHEKAGYSSPFIHDSNIIQDSGHLFDKKETLSLTSSNSIISVPTEFSHQLKIEKKESLLKINTFLKPGYELHMHKT